MNTLRLFLTVLSLIPSIGFSENPRQWVINFGKTLDFADYNPYSIIVLEENPSPLVIEILREQDKEVLGHIHLGQIDSKNRFYQMAKKEGLISNRENDPSNTNYIEIANPKWTKMVIEWMIPYTLFSRFDGLILEGVDSFLKTQKEDSKEYTDFKTAFAHLIKTIRLHYPQLKIALKNGYSILPEIAGDIDIEIAEATYTQYNADEKKYTRTEDQFYEKRLKALNSAKEINPNLEILTLDYWPLDDTSTIKKIYEKQREQGFLPYVTTFEKEQIVPEPK